MKIAPEDLCEGEPPEFIRYIEYTKGKEIIVLPKTQLVTAFFSIPFCDPNYFNILWKKIYDAIETNGYFVGQLFGDRDAWKDSDWVNTFSKNEVLVKLEKYELLLFHKNILKLYLKI